MFSFLRYKDCIKWLISSSPSASFISSLCVYFVGFSRCSYSYLSLLRFIPWPFAFLPKDTPEFPGFMDPYEWLLFSMLFPPLLSSFLVSCHWGRWLGVYQESTLCHLCAIFMRFRRKSKISALMFTMEPKWGLSHPKLSFDILTSVYSMIILSLKAMVSPLLPLLFLLYLVMPSISPFLIIPLKFPWPTL